MAKKKTPWEKLISTYKGTSIDHDGLKLVTLAQWALESGFGKSDLATKHNNFAGLKYRQRMADHATPVDYPAHDGIDTYCKFDSLKAFIHGYWHFIASGPYDGWEAFGDDPLGYIRHIKAKGYAADPNYVSKIAKVYDRLAEELGSDEELDRPHRRELGDVQPVMLEPVTGAPHRKRSAYPNGLEGLIVHYDAGRIRPKYADNEDSDYGSRGTITWGSSQGYRYLCISRTGRVFAPDNWDWDHWGYHAGTSECPVTGRTSVSRYYVGVEMNNPGYLYEAQEDGVFCPWYNSKRTENGRIIHDGRGRVYRADPDDEWFSRDQVRHASGGNITPGYYLPYTHAQYDALKGVVLAAATARPASFRFDLIFGHDEISPGRKQDPGGALAYEGRVMIMAEFRAEVAALHAAIPIG